MLTGPMLEQTVQIVSNERDTDSYFRLVLRAPQIAPLIQPGQFAHVRVLPLKDALLRRPFSVFQVEGDTFSILYKTIGKGSQALSRMQPGEEGLVEIDDAVEGGFLADDLAPERRLELTDVVTTSRGIQHLLTA